MAPVGRLERCSAWIMLANGALGLLVALIAALLRQSPAGLVEHPPYTSLLGVLAAVLALRGMLAGLASGALFYGVQVVSYYGAGLQFNFRSGLSLGAVVHAAAGVVVINLAALAGLAVIVLVAYWRWRRPA